MVFEIFGLALQELVVLIIPVPRQQSSQVNLLQHSIRVAPHQEPIQPTTPPVVPPLTLKVTHLAILPIYHPKVRVLHPTAPQAKPLPVTLLQGLLQIIHQAGPLPTTHRLVGPHQQVLPL
jgi:hypothetical protein